ncbi:multidrug and toxin extrusion protein 1 isoform X2 [Esox lucius]|uniref:multidrug and toxin extrusion protein 1 isoform X2 n=1 Tax=Esox lucius TaxID=8010 RepID=UPI00147721C2|nr:multidrug and toxin extrusion protein 1 isoform X2 [Esox lucius]
MCLEMATNGTVERRTNENESYSCSSTICGNCLMHIHRLIPVDFKKEIVQLSTMAAPVIMAQIMVFLLSFISTVFCGHLGKTELAAVALAVAVTNITGVSIGSGLSSACDTLISQTFGSRNLLKVGVILQRALLIQLLACFPCWAILINTEPLLLAVRQSPELARLAQTYVKILMPALPATFIYQLEVRYLRNQGIIWPQVITGVVANLLNALINYIYLYALNLGVIGSAWANTISQFSLALMLYAYILWKGLHKATWGGWSWECLEEWGTYIYLAIPSMVMLCVEWWTYEIGSFLAGSLSVCFSVLVGILKDHISYVFTYDEQIRERVAQVMAFYSPFLILDAMTAASGSIIRGVGKQKVGAICSILGFYGIGFPIGIPLMFAAKLGIMGLWTGLFSCAFLQSSVLIVYLSKMSWKKATVEAQIRAGVQSNSTDMNMAPNTHSDDSPPRGGHMDQTAQAKDGAEVDGETSDGVAPSTVGVLLSRRALLLRRGLALCFMLFILALGIVVNLLLTNVI